MLTQTLVHQPSLQASQAQTRVVKLSMQITKSSMSTDSQLSVPALLPDKKLLTKLIQKIKDMSSKIRNLQTQNGFSCGQIDKYLGKAVMEFIGAGVVDINYQSQQQNKSKNENMFGNLIGKIIKQHYQQSQQILINIIKCLETQLNILSEQRKHEIQITKPQKTITLTTKHATTRMQKLQKQKQQKSQSFSSLKNLLNITSFKNKKRNQYQYKIPTDSLSVYHNFAQGDNQRGSYITPRKDRDRQKQQQYSNYQNNYPSSYTYQYQSPKQIQLPQQVQQQRPIIRQKQKEKQKQQKRFKNLRQLYRQMQAADTCTNNNNSYSQLDNIEKSIQETLERTRKLRKFLHLKELQSKLTEEKQREKLKNRYREQSPRQKNSFTGSTKMTEINGDQDEYQEQNLNHDEEDECYEQNQFKDDEQDRDLQIDLNLEIQLEMHKAQLKQKQQTDREKNGKITFQSSLDRYNSIFID